VCPERFLATGGLAASPHLTARIAESMSVGIVVDPRPHRTAVGAALLARDGR
jgi:sugar (pentulose or hexulose) kinase